MFLPRKIITILCLGWVAQLVGMVSHIPKGFKFDSQSGHIPRLWIRFLGGWGGSACTGSSRSVFLSSMFPLMRVKQKLPYCGELSSSVSIEGCLLLC